MSDDPYVRKLVERSRQDATPGSRLARAALALAIPFFSVVCGKLVLTFIALGHAPRFPAVLAWPAGLAAGLVTFSILMAFATSLAPPNRNRFACALTLIGLLITVCW
jgi:hypothetical protein